MIVELTPETYFEQVKKEGPLNVVMHYGITCGPCKMTMPYYELIDTHFLEHNVTNVKFYKFHHWEQEYKQFIDSNKLVTKGVPTFKYFYMGDIINEETRSFNNPDELKKSIMEVIMGIESTMGSFNLHEN
jgi:thiol-disulfide isomerase/thioredoxin